MFKATLIVYRTHYLSLPINKSFSATNPIVKIKQLANSISVEEVYDEKLSEDNVEGVLGIKEQDKDWFFESE